MSKEAKALLKKINDLKNAIRGMQGQGKTAEMKAEMEKLRALQDEFNVLMELEDGEIDGVEGRVKDGAGKVVEGSAQKPTKADVVRAFVNRIVCGLRRRPLPEADQKIMDAMSEAEADDETGLSDGGFTVPQDITTDIIELRRTSDDLEQYVNVERVSTMSGSRVIEVDADATAWPDVDEGDAMTEKETPKFKQIKYEIAKRGGILKVTRELLQDTAENILAYLNKWIAKKSRATRNAAILSVLDTITASGVVALSDFDDFKDVFNVTLDPSIAASSIVLTNQDGFNFMDKLKDEDGKYLIQPDVTDKSKRLLFGVHPVVVISNKVLASAEVKSGSTVTAHKYPVFMGDLKEAITLFDREKMSIELSTEAGDLWAKDLTGVKVRDRFDVQPVDTSAVVKGEITESVGG